MISPTYPYKRVQQYNSFAGVEKVTRQVFEYLVDLPQPGYEPPDDNTYPRARFIKYVYYDDEFPLSHPLPTPDEKTRLIYNPTDLAIPQDAPGYRLFPTTKVSQVQTDEQTVVRLYIGQVFPYTPFQAELSLIFDILCNERYETNLKGVTMVRSYAIEQAILESLNGVNMAGIGTFYFDRNRNSNCSSYNISDDRRNRGRRLTMGLTYGASPTHECI